MRDIVIDAVIGRVVPLRAGAVNIHLDDGSEGGGPWMTIDRQDWPIAYWPPAEGDIVSVRQPMVTLKARPRKGAER